MKSQARATGCELVEDTLPPFTMDFLAHFMALGAVFRLPLTPYPEELLAPLILKTESI